jgi:hypothetical protein
MKKFKNLAVKIVALAMVALVAATTPWAGAVIEAAADTTYEQPFGYDLPEDDEEGRR